MPEEPAWAEPPAWIDPVVPDDIRELQPDVDAYHRELRAARRRQRWQRWTGGRTWRRWSFPIGVMTGALALATAVFGLLAVDGATGHSGRLTPLPLATPTVADASVGGLLPDVVLTSTQGRPVAARGLRPALIALLPAHCDCVQLLSSLAGQADEVQLPIVIVGAGMPDADIAALPGQIRHDQVLTMYDEAGLLASSVRADGVTAVIVRRDGVIAHIARQVTPSTRLELPLQVAFLLPPGNRS